MREKYVWFLLALLANFIVGPVLGSSVFAIMYLAEGMMLSSVLIMLPAMYIICCLCNVPLYIYTRLTMPRDLLLGR